MGIFSDFIDDKDVQLVGVEAAGEGLTARHGATLQKGRVGILHGSRSFVLQDDDGQIQESHSISAGLDYPGVGPEHAQLQASGRARYVGATDAQALDAFAQLSRSEGILPALEPAHALAYALERSEQVPPDTVLLVNLSGRGDKDLETVQSHLAAEVRA
jgi:tryptophan synthase beta chain